MKNKKSTADVCWNTSFCPSSIIWKNDTFRTKKSTADVRWNTSFCPWLVKYGPDVLINLYLKNLLTLWRWISPGRGSKRVVSMVKEAYLCSIALKIKANLCTWQQEMLYNMVIPSRKIAMPACRKNWSA